MNAWLWVADLLVAQGEGSQPNGGGGLFGGGIVGMLPLLLMFLVIYFLLIRPASKQRREHQELLNGLKKDDEVVTAGGIYGKIAAIDERVVTLEIADKVKVRILRDRVAGRWMAQATPNKK